MLLSRISMLWVGHLIFVTGQAKLAEKYFTEELSKVLPTFTNNVAGLYKHRAKSIPILPTSAEDIKLSDKYKVTISPKPDRLLLYDNEKARRLMLLCSPINLLILSLCENWHADGTFHTVSKYFGQMYTIHGWYEHRMLSCA